MQIFKSKNEEAVKTTRYNRVPDHLVGKVDLLKCDSAFLPDPRSCGQGAGKIDQAEAIANVQKRKQEALEQQSEGGGGGSAPGKTREHLETKKRVGSGGAGRENLSEALVSLVQTQQQTAHINSRRLALDERNQKSELLDKYMQYLMNPHIPVEIKSNYQTMVLSLQAKLLAADMGPSAPATPLSPATPQFMSPVRSRESTRDTSATSPSSSSVEDNGLLPGAF